MRPRTDLESLNVDVHVHDVHEADGRSLPLRRVRTGKMQAVFNFLLRSTWD